MPLASQGEGVGHQGDQEVGEGLLLSECVEEKRRNGNRERAEELMYVHVYVLVKIYIISKPLRLLCTYMYMYM